jgi:hypothetical protein
MEQGQIMHETTRTRTRLARLQLVAAGLAAVIASAPAVAEVDHEFLFFPSVDGLDTFSESDPSVKDSDIYASLDLLYSVSGNRFRFLGEFLWSSEEAEFERLQAGYRVGDDTFVWGGRFHAPAKIWTSEYHHGQYLQTSITRPALEEWEDDGGSNPSHITGLLLESEHQRDDESAIGVAASVGLAPVFEDELLESYEILEETSDHGLSLNLRLAYRPQFLSSTQFGILAGWNEINVQPEPDTAPDRPESIDQAILGIFADWYRDNLRLLASFVYFDNTLELPSRDQDDTYLLGYVQLEYEANAAVTVFGRVEGGIDQDDSAYLQLFESAITERYMLGVRWDVAEYHALTAEIADTTYGASVSGSRSFGEFRLQWSAVFP